MGDLWAAGQGVTGKDRIVTAILTHDEMTEPLKRARRSGAEGAGDTKEYGLSERVTVQDVDQEVGLALTSLGCEFHRKEARGVVTYFIHRDSLDLGRLVIAPPTRVFPYIRIREHYPMSELRWVFEALCRQVREDLEALCDAAEQVEVRENTFFSYPRAKRRQIVEEYRAALMNGEVENKETWAQTRYAICRKTLWRYEREFPETDEA